MKRRVSLLISMAALGTTCKATAEGDAKQGRAHTKAAHTAKLFAALDRNRDGRLSRRELYGAFRRHLSRRIAERFNQLDRDGDDRVVPAEVRGMATARFARFDLDHDGCFTQAELTTVMYEKMRQRLTSLLASMDTDGDQTCSYTELGAHRDELARARQERRDRQERVAAAEQRPSGEQAKERAEVAEAGERSSGEGTL